MRAVVPPTAVTVRRPDGVWPGWLSAWRHTHTGWRAFVTYRRGPGMTHVHWVEASAVSPASAQTLAPAAAGDGVGGDTLPR